MSVSDERERASGLSLSQLETFLALVEEGSMSRASRRLGVGRSSISAQIKAVGDDFNQRLFVRVQNGLAITPAGNEAYRLLRPLMEQSAQCLAHFRAGIAAAPIKIQARLPDGFSGALIDQAVGLVARSLTHESSAIWLTSIYGASDVSSDGALALKFGGREIGTRTGAICIDDRWILVRTGEASGWASGEIALADLSGLTVTVPRLPEAQMGLLLSLAERTQMRINFTSSEIHEVLAEGAQKRDFHFLVPAALLNAALVSEQFECAVLEASDLDPGLLVMGLHSPELGPAISAHFANLYANLFREQRDTADSEPDRLSLKHCRSFLALYEERNMRRAAQRLSIVQPALTVQLHGLEELLGTPLFVRSHRGLQPNERAEQLHKLIAPLMAELGAVVRSLRGTIGGRSRRLRLGLIPALDAESETAEYFADALNRWSVRHPEIIVQVLEAYSGKLLQWLSAGRIDFALIDRVVPDSEMTFDLIAEDRMAVVIQSSTGLLPPGPVTLEAASKLPLVLPSSRHGLRSILLPQLRKAGLELNPRIEVDSMAAALSLVKIGRYATILPVGAIYKSRDRRHLSIHEICEPQILRSICLVKMRNELAESATQEFIEELRIAFANAGEFTEEAAQELDQYAAPRLASLRLA